MKRMLSRCPATMGAPHSFTTGSDGCTSCGRAKPDFMGDFNPGPRPYTACPATVGSQHMFEQGACVQCGRAEEAIEEIAVKEAQVDAGPLADMVPEIRSAALATLDQVQVQWDQMDADDNGFVTLEELTAVLKKEGLEEAHVDEIFESMDSSHDGKISKEEFVNGFGEYKSKLQHIKLQLALLVTELADNLPEGHEEPTEEVQGAFKLKTIALVGQLKSKFTLKKKAATKALRARARLRTAMLVAELAAEVSKEEQPVPPAAAEAEVENLEGSESQAPVQATPAPSKRWATALLVSKFASQLKDAVDDDDEEEEQQVEDKGEATKDSAEETEAAAAPAEGETQSEGEAEAA